MQGGGDGELREEFCPVTIALDPLDPLTVTMENGSLMGRNKNSALVRIRGGHSLKCRMRHAHGNAGQVLDKALAISPQRLVPTRLLWQTEYNRRMVCRVSQRQGSVDWSVTIQCHAAY